ncbi:VOC family protein [Priestia megaterium]|uniref:VOC family protein n=1 Tax=Priestia megaterium TaxID=1404 RepID=UPI002E22A6FD|nr:VOC family protein [Priestia megaterium]MED4279304.1 VOC family protein [Priestia megaterium]MED4319580.1 VOC family protein [Priestia megaterium]
MTNITRGIDHIGVTVPEIEEATVFFKKAFDAKIAYDNKKLEDESLAGPDVEKTLGVKKGTKVVHMRILSFENSASIELFKFANTDQRPPSIASDYGVQHFAFYMDDIKEAANRFVEAGGELLNDPGELLGDVEEGTGHFVYGRAPWGMLIELISYTPNELDYPEESEAKRFTP